MQEENANLMFFKGKKTPTFLKLSKQTLHIISMIMLWQIVNWSASVVLERIVFWAVSWSLIIANEVACDDLSKCSDNKVIQSLNTEQDRYQLNSHCSSTSFCFIAIWFLIISTTFKLHNTPSPIHMTLSVLYKIEFPCLVFLRSMVSLLGN